MQGYLICIVALLYRYGVLRISVFGHNAFLYTDKSIKRRNVLISLYKIHLGVAVMGGLQILLLTKTSWYGKTLK